MISLKDLVLKAKSHAASDVLVMVGDSPAMRVAGEWIRFDIPRCGAEEMNAAIRELLRPEAWDELQAKRELDFSSAFHGAGRVRCNLHYQRDNLSLVMRLVWPTIPKASDLGIPENVVRCGDIPHGLVLVSGPTGSGKSTTLAAIVEHINQAPRGARDHAGGPDRVHVHQREIDHRAARGGVGHAELAFGPADGSASGAGCDRAGGTAGPGIDRHCAGGGGDGPPGDGVGARIDGGGRDLADGGCVSAIADVAGAAATLANPEHGLCAAAGAGQEGTDAHADVRDSHEHDGGIEPDPGRGAGTASERDRCGRDKGMISFAQCQRELMAKGLLPGGDELAGAMAAVA